MRGGTESFTLSQDRTAEKKRLETDLTDVNLTEFRSEYKNYITYGKPSLIFLADFINIREG